ncbi:hypothetical protein D3C73_1634860 [compost metagenome]
MASVTFWMPAFVTVIVNGTMSPMVVAVKVVPLSAITFGEETDDVTTLDGVDPVKIRPSGNV